MAELPEPRLESLSPKTLEKIMDGVLELEKGERSLMELEEDLFGYATRDYTPRKEGEIAFSRGQFRR